MEVIYNGYDDHDVHHFVNAVPEAVGIQVDSDLTKNQSFFYLNSDTKIFFNEVLNNVEPIYNSALRNLIDFCKETPPTNSISLKKFSYFGASEVESVSYKASNFVSLQVQREKEIKQSNASFFANSAYYMGCKKTLGPFLVEAISRFLPLEGVIIDLMCGSGAASNAFGTIWPTYASDAQDFCRYLALVQGKGFNRERAQKIIEKIYPLAMKNANDLGSYFDEYMKQEDHFFHSNIDLGLFNDYKDFVNETSLYPTNESLLGWQLNTEVEARKQNPSLTPYCLFTTYFANIYFGLRQSVEIDSIRYAIDQLDDSNDRDWALGALISTLSYLGSGYAGHFAQPLQPTLKKMPQILENRAKSVMHEFSVRLTALARESEHAKNPIQILPGPWQETLAAAEKRLYGKDVVVYLDAPYKREEYSRYYHLLETAVKYNYPSATKKGRLPDKNNGERFKSAFFTRDRGKVEATFVEIILSILERGWICAWSYSDNGDASITDVISQVYSKKKCHIISFATPYQHKSQGKKKQKNVTEYCILFKPT